jgi:hypothetical protein
MSDLSSSPTGCAFAARSAARTVRGRRIVVTAAAEQAREQRGRRQGA